MNEVHLLVVLTVGVAVVVVSIKSKAHIVTQIVKSEMRRKVLVLCMEKV